MKSEVNAADLRLLEHLDKTNVVISRQFQKVQQSFSDF